MSFTTQYTNQVALLRLTTVVTNNFVNEVRASYQRNGSFLSQDSPFTNTEVGITSLATSTPILSLISAGTDFSVGNFIYNYFQRKTNSSGPIKSPGPMENKPSAPASKQNAFKPITKYPVSPSANRPPVPSQTS